MEHYLRQRIDCPPPGGTRTLMEEKDSIIKKQQDELIKLQSEIRKVQAERDHLLTLLSDEEKATLEDRSEHSVMPPSNTCPINPYELCQDLHEKQLEMLERKYGGHLRCRRAATIIQRAYRQYKMKENFRHLCATVNTSKRLSCSFVDHHPHQRPPIKPLKPCLRIPKQSCDDYNSCPTSSSSSSSNTPTNPESSVSHFNDRHLDLPSINFEHFIETSKKPVTLLNSRKRVCIVTDVPATANIYDQVDESSDFIDDPSKEIRHGSINGLVIGQLPVNSCQFYQDLTGSPLECRKPIPPVRSLSLKPPRPILTSMVPVNTSPIWKRKTLLSVTSPSTDLPELTDLFSDQLHRSVEATMSPSSTTSSDRDSMSLQSTSSESNTSCSLSNRTSSNSMDLSHRPALFIERPAILHGQERLATIRSNETYRRRCYRAGLNIFNKKPERGIRYLMIHRFLEPTPQAVARFLLSRKGLSRQMIGEYLGNLQDPFAMQVLHAFVDEFDFQEMPIDLALRKFQASFRLPGEAQKIEQLMKVFSQRYYATNPSSTTTTMAPSNVDTIFILAFAIIMLNTDLHSRNIKAERKMRLEQFIKNLRAIDDGDKLDRKYLTGIYERIRAEEFRPDIDHVSQVIKFEQTLVGKKPPLIAAHRRLVCYCRLYEVYEPNKREKLTSHQREVYLFNDLLVITKISGKKHQQFRQALRLAGMNVSLFETSHYSYGIRLVRQSEANETTLLTFNARNEHDRTKFCEDLKEAILETDEMEGLRVQSELEKIRSTSNTLMENSSHGVISSLIDYPTQKRERPLSRTLSNSLLDMALPISKTIEANHPFLPCRTSQCSLDSGMVSLTNDFSPNNRLLLR